MVTVDKFGDDTATKMFNAYSSMEIKQFLLFCEQLITENMVSNKQKKDTFIRAIRECRTKDRAVTKMTNFFLAGEGLSVGY